MPVPPMPVPPMLVLWCEMVLCGAVWHHRTGVGLGIHPAQTPQMRANAAKRSSPAAVEIAAASSRSRSA